VRLTVRITYAEEPIMKAIMVAVALLAVGLLLGATASSDTVYRWTDEKGVQRFSNEPPPEGVENFQKFQSQPTQPDGSGAGDSRRPSYDQMVQKASQSADHMEQQRKAQAAARAAEQKRLAEERRQAKIQAERSRLLQRIEAIKIRAVSPTFPMGMKQAQIDKIKKQIDALGNNKPDAAAASQQGKTAESPSGY
jgi:cell division septum initiation protein DivIVA